MVAKQLSSVQSFILTGASGAGKSSVAKGLELITDGPYKFERAKAVVTRPPRGPEDDDYIFVSNKLYDSMSHAGRLLLETPSYNYRGAILPYAPPSPDTYPLYILTPLNAQRLQNVLEPRPRIVHIDRLATNAIASLLADRPTMSQEDIELRLQQGAADRVTAREIEDIGIDNDGSLSQTVSTLHEMLVADIERHNQLAIA